MQEPISLPDDSEQLLGPQHAGPLGYLLMYCCKAMAICGSLVFVLLVIMSIVSITGRKLWASPIPGDVELLQMCSAFAAACYFAYCHLNGGDVKVDFFTSQLSPATVHLFDAFGSSLVTVFGALIAWRAGIGAWGIKLAGETTMILDLPLWWGQILMVPGFVLLSLAGLYRCYWHLTQAKHCVSSGEQQ